MSRTPRFRARRADGDQGYALALTALLLVPLLIATAFSVDAGAWYALASRIQRASDAASLAGVVHLPDQSKAIRAALDVAASNGFSSANCPGTGPVKVCVVPDVERQQVTVTIEAPAHIFFGKVAGVSSLSITRTATAEYIPAIPMGTPLSQLGNDPDLGFKPDFWLGQVATANPKGNGDRYSTLTCNTPAGTGPTTMSGCGGSGYGGRALNNEREADGYFYVVRVPAAAAGKTINVQVFDPAFVDGENDCSLNNTGGTGARCTGDNSSAENSLAADPSKGCINSATYTSPDTATNPLCTPTTYIVRAPDLTPNNHLDNSPVCGITFKGYNTPVNSALNASTDPYANARFDTFFHKWYTVCQIPSAVAGDYILQVKTNANLTNLGSTPKTTATAGLNLGTTGTSGSRVHTLGQNNFSLRVGVNGQTVGSAAWSSGITLSAAGKFPIYVNATTASPNFYLARITNAYAGTTLLFDFFDIGDATNAEAVTLTPPTDAQNPPNTCAWTRDGSSSLAGATVSGCKISNLTKANYNGRLTTAVVSVPATYSCDEASATGCWFKVNIATSGTPNDFTTWSARVIGDPVHLVN